LRDFNLIRIAKALKFFSNIAVTQQEKVSIATETTTIE